MKKCKGLTSLASIVLVVFLSTILDETLSAQTTIPFQHKPPHVYPAKTNSFTGSQDTLSLIGQWGWGECMAVVVRGNYAFIGNGSLLQVLDISNPKTPQILGQVDVGSYIFGLVVSGNYAYMTPGFSIIDISDVTHPQVISNLSIPLMASSIAVSGDYAYIGNILGEIYTINISDPAQPYIVSGYAMMATEGDFIGSIVVVDTLLYATSFEFNSANIFNISNPLSPFRYSNTFGDRGELIIQGHYMFVGAIDYNTLWMYDISQPLYPRFINGVDLRSSPTTIFLRDSLVYVSEADSAFDGFEIVDVADTSNIRVLARMPFFYNFPANSGVESGSFGIDSTIACIACNNGLWIVDISKVPVLTTDYFLGTGSGYDANIGGASGSHRCRSRPPRHWRFRSCSG